MRKLKSRYTISNIVQLSFFFFFLCIGIQVLEEEPNKNYFCVFWVIPKISNAGWELVRGFLLPFVKGGDYKETKVMTMVRLLGLIVSGIPAHLPPYYVNSTRLGSFCRVQDLPVSQDTKID